MAQWLCLVTKMAEQGSFVCKMYDMGAGYGISKFRYFVWSKFQVLVQEFLLF
jgi:hypothetical protein